MPFEALWKDLRGDPKHLSRVEFTGAAAGLPSRFRVAELAAATIAAASLAAAELWAARNGTPVRRVLVDRRLACAAFRCERLVSPLGWKLPSIWDPIAGDYRAADGWIRLHTNYANHRAAVIRVLGVAVEREAVAKAVSQWPAEKLELAVVEAGGAAAALRTREDWQSHPQGAALASEPLVSWGGSCVQKNRKASAASPLSGIRILDLTRVIAGPFGTRFLAAMGAEVLRIDPPGFEEVGALLPEATKGKRCAALDLRKDRARWEELVAGADLLVHGYRPGAMEALGYGADRLSEINPALVEVRHDAYGWTGPWAARRGFDSLVQMSSGIAHPGKSAGNDGKPTPLPAQALDHGTGFLIAAAACRALVDRRRSARLSLARTARFLLELGLEKTEQQDDDAKDLLEKTETEWGPAMQVPNPGKIEGYEVQWAVRAGPLGRHEPCWSTLP